MRETVIELDDRRRVGLGKIGHHNRYIVQEFDDGRLVWSPARVITEEQYRLLGDPEFMDALEKNLSETSADIPRKTRAERLKELDS